MKFDILTVVDDTSSFISSTTGSGFPRLFEGDTGLYIYRLIKSLQMSSDGGFSFNEILPIDRTAALAISQSSEQVGATSVSVTQIFSSGSNSSDVATGKYQIAPETPTGWSNTGNLGTTFIPVDAIADSLGEGPILVGNNLQTGTVKMRRNPDEIPYTTFVESDQGLPQSGTNSAIIDLEGMNN